MVPDAVALQGFTADLLQARGHSEPPPRSMIDAEGVTTALVATRLFGGNPWATRSYIAGKGEYFFGVKVHLLPAAGGHPVEAFLTSGGRSDTRAVKQFQFNLPSESVMIGDKAYNGGVIEPRRPRNGGTRFFGDGLFRYAFACFFRDAFAASDGNDANRRNYVTYSRSDYPSRVFGKLGLLRPNLSCLPSSGQLFRRTAPSSQQ